MKLLTLCQHFLMIEVGGGLVIFILLLLLWLLFLLFRLFSNLDFHSCFAGLLPCPNKGRCKIGRLGLKYYLFVYEREAKNMKMCRWCNSSLRINCVIRASFISDELHVKGGLTSIHNNLIS